MDTKVKARKQLPEVIFKCINSINKILPITEEYLDYGSFGDGWGDDNHRRA